MGLLWDNGSNLSGVVSKCNTSGYRITKEPLDWKTKYKFDIIYPNGSQGMFALVNTPKLYPYFDGTVSDGTNTLPMPSISFGSYGYSSLFLVRNYTAAGVCKDILVGNIQYGKKYTYEIDMPNKILRVYLEGELIATDDQSTSKFILDGTSPVYLEYFIVSNAYGYSSFTVDTESFNIIEEKYKIYKDRNSKAYSYK